LILESIPVGIFRCNCVILGDEATREAVVIDPGDDLEAIREILDHHKLTLKTTLHTHGHLDHIGAAGELRRERGSQARIHRGDLPLWRDYPRQAALFGLPPRSLPEPDGLLAEGDEIRVGGIVLDVLETPGHTPGSVCFRLAGGAPGAGDPILFSGDTLFWKGIGRTDLWGGDYPRILASIRDRIFALPEETIVHPGHGPLTSIRDERRANPFLPDILAAP
jgi:glyoxylase-like metal-dependent hydrolase (beta-lactamase superfamily II)